MAWGCSSARRRAESRWKVAGVCGTVERDRGPCGPASGPATFPIDGAQLLLDARTDPLAVVVVDLQAEQAVARRASAWPMRPMPIIAQLFAAQPPAQHEGRASSRKNTARADQVHFGAFDQCGASRGHDQGHGHVGGVLGQHAGSVGHDRCRLDVGGGDVDMGRPRRRNWRSASGAVRPASSRAASIRSVMVGTKHLGVGHAGRQTQGHARGAVHRMG